jgi:orotate phosphoribosyltransferase
MEQYVKDFVGQLVSTGSLFFDKKYLETGEVSIKLKDGRRALYFINMGKMCDGRSGIVLGAAYAHKIKDDGIQEHFDILYAPPYKGITIIIPVSMELARMGINKAWAFRRKEAKGHGEKGDYVGAEFYDGCKLLLGDDVISSAETKFNEMDEISLYEKKNGIKIGFSGLLIGVDRQQKAVIGGRIGEKGVQIDKDALEYFSCEKGIPARSIVQIEEAMHYIYENRLEGPDGKQVVTDMYMREFEKYQKEFGLHTR